MSLGLGVSVGTLVEVDIDTNLGNEKFLGVDQRESLNSVLNESLLPLSHLDCISERTGQVNHFATALGFGSTASAAL